MAEGIGQKAVACVPNPASIFFFFYKIKFYWNTATSICLHIVCGCFPDTMPEVVSSCNPDNMASKLKVFSIWTFTENVFPPWYKLTKGVGVVK